MANQQCPACGMLHNVSIYVSGQQVQCSNCGLSFKVERNDSAMIDPEQVRPSLAGRREPIERQSDDMIQAPSSLDNSSWVAIRSQKPLAQTARTSVEAKGFSIQGYRLYEMRGKGGMGRVYRALQESLDRIVAIKVLNQDLARHQSFIRRFEKESGALAALNHPNIITVIDRGHVGSTYYFVMEYVGGSSLRHKMNRGVMKPNQAVELMVVMCRAVDHAHQRGVIHRDIKPENMLFTPEGVLKVADFGLANILDADRRWELTRTKVSMGTVNYMAPEQRRDAKHVDHRADIYSLGVLFYEMLVGELPLGKFDPPSFTCKELDQRTDRLVLKMLESDPDRRPQRAELVAASLERIFQLKASTRSGRVGDPSALDKIDPDVKPPSTMYQSEDPPVAQQASKATPTDASADRPRRPKIPTTLVAVVGSVLLLALAAIGIVTLLLYQELESSPGDLVLHHAGKEHHLQVTHPRQVKYLSPAFASSQPGRRSVLFDFQPSSQPALPVTLIGGTWEVERGMLIQDTCRSAFTINQVPARALFGRHPLQASKGIQLRVSLTVHPTTYTTPDGRRLSMEQFIKESLGAYRMMLPVRMHHQIGVGLMDKEGAGLEILLALGQQGMGSLTRRGVKMEGGNREFPLAQEITPGTRIHELALGLSQGRVRAYLSGQPMVDEMAGLPLGFEGYPTISCQNARCVIHSLEYSQ